MCTCLWTPNLQCFLFTPSLCKPFRPTQIPAVGYFLRFLKGRDSTTRHTLALTSQHLKPVLCDRHTHANALPGCGTPPAEMRHVLQLLGCAHRSWHSGHELWARTVGLVPRCANRECSPNAGPTSNRAMPRRPLLRNLTQKQKREQNRTEMRSMRTRN